MFTPTSFLMYLLYVKDISDIFTLFDQEIKKLSVENDETDNDEMDVSDSDDEEKSFKKRKLDIETNSLKVGIFRTQSLSVTTLRYKILKYSFCRMKTTACVVNWKPIRTRFAWYEANCNAR